MKKTIVFFAILMLGMMVVPSFVHAAPMKTWTWTDATNFLDGTIIPPGDLSTKLYCGLNQGGPYIISQLFSTASPSTEDMAFVVQGVPSIWVYCVATHISAMWFSESAYSNEQSFITTPEELDKVPMPPVITSVAALIEFIETYAFDVYLPETVG